METTELSKQKDESLIIEVISHALKAPGVKVNRNAFLSSFFEAADPQTLRVILEEGPIAAGYKREKIYKLAKGLVNKRTLETSGISFVAGIPGGFAMAGTIPADIIQFYGFALRMVQEIAYLYGMNDLWEAGELDSDEVLNSLILYLGVMLGASGASATLKAMSAALAGQAAKKLPQKALMQTIYYPMIKSIAKFFGKSMTKEIFAKGVSKVIPVIGGVASGGLTLATMRPMGMRLVTCLDEASFDYSESDFENDLEEIREVMAAEVLEVESVEDAVFETAPEVTRVEVASVADAAFDFEGEIAKAKRLLDIGAISEEEYSEIKAKIIARI